MTDSQSQTFKEIIDCFLNTNFKNLNKDFTFGRLAVPNGLKKYIIASLNFFLESKFKLKEGLLNKNIRFFDTFCNSQDLFLAIVDDVYEKIKSKYGVLGEEIAFRMFDKTLKMHVNKNFFFSQKSINYEKEKEIKINKNFKDNIDLVLAYSSVVMENQMEAFVRNLKFRLTEFKQGVVTIVTDSDFWEANNKSGLRKELLEMFNEIYLYNLHGGRSKIKIGSSRAMDEPVMDFDNNLVFLALIKYPHGEESYKIKYKNLWGESDYKMQALLDDEHVLKTKWRELEPKEPYWFFVKKDTRAAEEYIKYWDIVDIVPNYGETAEENFEEPGLSFNFSVIGNAPDITSMAPATNRPIATVFDFVVGKWDYRFPIFISSNDYYQDSPKRELNLNPMFLDIFSKKIKMSFGGASCGDLLESYGPVDLFYYIYSCFYSTSYRKRYGEQLEMDFPRVPLTRDKSVFKHLCGLGRKLVNFHFLGKNPFDKKSNRIYEDLTQWMVRVGGAKENDLSNWKVTAIFYDKKNERIYVNSSRYFEKVSEKVWDYSVLEERFLESWLKKMKTRSTGMDIDDLMLFLKTIVAIRETVKISDEIDRTIGKWPMK
jgi:hypothetical protein